MQELIDWAKSLQYNQQQCIDWIVIKDKAEQLLEKEEVKKETLEEAAFDSSIDYKPFEDNLSPKKYYQYGFEKGAKSDAARDYWYAKFEQDITSKVTRVEVIQHSPPHNGRAYTNYNAKDVEIQLQDENKTFKIFLK